MAPAPGSTDYRSTNWTVGTTAPGGGNFACFHRRPYPDGQQRRRPALDWARPRSPATSWPRASAASGRPRQWRCAHADRRRAVDGPATGDRGPHGNRPAAYIRRRARGRRCVQRRSFVIGQQSGSTGTVINLEQIRGPAGSSWATPAPDLSFWASPRACATAAPTSASQPARAAASRQRRRTDQQRRADGGRRRHGLA